MKLMNGRINSAHLLGVIAIVLALAGTGIAASVKLKRNAVKTKNIKNGAVTEKKIADGAVSTGKLGSGAKVAWARVGSSGPAIAASPGTTSRLRTSGGTGYCIDTPFEPKVAVVTLDFNNTGFPRGFVQIGDDGIHCPGSEATVRIYDAADALQTANFHLVLHG